MSGGGNQERDNRGCNKISKAQAHVDFAKNGVAIVCHDNASEGIKKHFEHRSGAKSGADDVRNRFGSLDVGQLSLVALLTLHRLVHNIHGGLAVHCDFSGCSEASTRA